MNPTSALFARTVSLNPGERVLLMHSGDSELARWVVDQVSPEGQVVALHHSYSSLAGLGDVHDVELSDLVYPSPSKHGTASTILMTIPKGRLVARACLWTAAQVLEPGGRLYLAGPNARGAKTAIHDAEALFGTAPVLGYKSSRRIAMATRPEQLDLPHAWGDEQPWTPQMRALHRPEGQILVITMPGVFSWEHLDEGTALLLDHLGVEAGLDVLDIGCGYGIIGMVAARQGARVTMVDDNLLAVRCARNSVLANDLGEMCEVFPSDVTSAVRDHTYDLVLSNPPFHKGVDVDTSVATRIVREAAMVLRQDGRLRIVANRFLPYDRVMRDTFGNVTTIAATGRYRVLESTLG